MSSALGPISPWSRRAAWCRSRWPPPISWQQLGHQRRSRLTRARLFPLDKETLIASAKKTSRAIVIDEGYERYGVTAEMAAVIAEGAFYYLDAPVKRMGAMDVPVPFSPVLEDQTVPTAETVTEMAKTLCGRV